MSKRMTIKGVALVTALIMLADVSFGAQIYPWDDLGRSFISEVQGIGG